MRPSTLAFGLDLLSLGDRVSRFDEASQVARGMLDGESVTFDGRWVSAKGLRNDPPSVQPRMPLLIGASGERRMLRIVARDADIWNGEGDPATYAHKSAVLDRHCAELGRDPQAIRRTVGVPPACIRATREAAVAALAAIFERNGSSPADAHAWAASSPLADTRDAVVRLFRAWHAAGAEEAIIDQPSPLDDETIEMLAGPVRERLG